MRAKLVILGLALLLVFANLSIALADKPTPGHTPPGLSGTPPAGKGGQRHGLFGTVTAKGTDTFTVATKQGPVVVSVTSDTKFHIPTKRNATFADLAVGDRVAVSGTPTATGFVAKQVAVAPGQPTIRHRVGIVTAYTPGSSITIQDVRGGTETFVVTAQTVIRNPKGSGVAVGDRVTIVSRRDPGTDVFTARAIVVHPQ